MAGSKTAAHEWNRVALVIYRWSAEAQDRVLVDCLEPKLRALRMHGHVGTFWFDRFDARGPHVTLLFSLPVATRDAMLAELGNDLACYLSAHPDEEAWADEQVVERHEGCLGKTLCEADRLTGLAARDTFLLTDHASTEYPWSLTRNHGPEGAFWLRVEEMCWWSLQQLKAYPRSTGGRHGLALQFVHAVDQVIRRDGSWRVGFWRYSAARLFHFLDNERFDDAAFCIRSFPPWVGEANMRSFKEAWLSLEGGSPPFAGLDELVRRSQKEVDRSRMSEFGLLREVVHGCLAQLGVPTRLRATLFVFAWHAALLEGNA